MKKKILNDPVYGFVSIPYGILFDLIEHPWFQRLRRIKQLSLSHYVYPGALHTRFHHAIGALHLMLKTIEELRQKGVDITDEEAEAVSIAILLHDIGHGPFSHTLEHALMEITHEEISLLFMEELNKEFGGKLTLAMRIFQNDYHKKFLSQLISGQLDMDRMDYLNRDSYFTGVHEGVISYDRIINMLNVKDDELVVEEKGIYSIEKFLIARRLMYWQVYLHKTVLSAEIMLTKILERAKYLVEKGIAVESTPFLAYFLRSKVDQAQLNENPRQILDRFAQLDDTDFAVALKTWQNHDDAILSDLCRGLINRKLFRLEFQPAAFKKEYVQSIKDRIKKNKNIHEDEVSFFFEKGKETNSAYIISKEEIKILMKSGEVLPMSKVSNHGIKGRKFAKYYLWYPK